MTANKLLFPAAAFALALALHGCGDEGATAKKQTTAPEPEESAPAAQDEGPTVAVVNGIAIPASRIPFYFPSARGAVLNEQQRLAVIENMINSELIHQRAKEEGVAEELRQELIVAEQTVLGRAYVQRFLEKNPVSEEDVAGKYETLRREFEGKNEYRVAHILVADETLAKELLEKVRAEPESFADAARENSQDTGSAQNGGELSWVAPGNLVKPFSDAMQKTGRGEIHPAAVQTNFGWHIIRVDDIRPLSVPPLDEQMRNQLRQQAQAEKVNTHLKSLAEQATIERKTTPQPQ